MADDAGEDLFEEEDDTEDEDTDDEDEEDLDEGTDFKIGEDEEE